MLVSIPKCINQGGLLSRILLPEVPVLEKELQLPSETLSSLGNWGARVGEIFTVCDPQRQEYRARITAIGNDFVTVLPFVRICSSESPIHISLFQALPEKERFELILQKATEIGVNRIVPFTCQRSTSLRERDAGQKKSHRWPGVLLRAARQCRRAEIPELFPVLSWQQVLEASAAQADLSLICYEGPGTVRLAEVMKTSSPRKVALIIGPEGGFPPQEIEQAISVGVVPVGLGPRILRTETAAILAAALIQFSLGDLG